MAATTKMLKVTPLTEDNYSTWSEQMRSLLLCLRGSTYIDNCYVFSDLNQQEKLTFTEASLQIQITVSASLKHLVSRRRTGPTLQKGSAQLTNPYDLWNNLHDHFYPKSHMTRHRLKKEFFSMTMEENETIERFVGCIKKKQIEANDYIRGAWIPKWEPGNNLDTTVLVPMKDPVMHTGQNHQDHPDHLTGNEKGLSKVNPTRKVRPKSESGSSSSSSTQEVKLEPHVGARKPEEVQPHAQMYARTDLMKTLGTELSIPSRREPVLIGLYDLGWVPSS